MIESCKLNLHLLLADNSSKVVIETSVGYFCCIENKLFHNIYFSLRTRGKNIKLISQLRPTLLIMLDQDAYKKIIVVGIVIAMFSDLN
jgi:hypothetical protein